MVPGEALGMVGKLGRGTAWASPPPTPGFTVTVWMTLELSVGLGEDPEKTIR